ncbi:MAG: 2-oxoacid:ferredoxin oxidoreductase subunit gamma, partial [Dehalococcoidia bacterium]
MRHDIRVAGFGGQGVILAGLLIGKTAALYDGKEAVFTQSYGPEARGGASNAN